MLPNCHPSVLMYCRQHRLSPFFVSERIQLSPSGGQRQPAGTEYPIIEVWDGLLSSMGWEEAVELLSRQGRGPLILADFKCPERNLDYPGTVLFRAAQMGSKKYGLYRAFMQRGGLERLLYDADVGGFVCWRQTIGFGVGLVVVLG